MQSGFRYVLQTTLEVSREPYSETVQPDHRCFSLPPTIGFQMTPRTHLPSSPSPSPSLSLSLSLPIHTNLRSSLGIFYDSSVVSYAAQPSAHLGDGTSSGDTVGPSDSTHSPLHFSLRSISSFIPTLSSHAQPYDIEALYRQCK